MWSQNKKIENKLLKQPVHALDFLWTKRVQKQISKLHDYNLVIGHNRAATRGEITRANAHPFQDGNICLVHNGTLTDKTNLPDHLKYSVDSRAICHSMATIGVDATAKLLKGSFALVWVDHKDKSLNFLRNSERPLFFAYSEIEDCLYWASEGLMLDWILNRRKIYDAEILKLKEDTLVSYTLKGKVMVPVSREVVMYTAPKWNGYTHPASTYRGNVGKASGNITTKASTNSTAGTTNTSGSPHTTAGQQTNTNSGTNTTSRALTKVTNIDSYRRAPSGFPKIGDLVEVYIHTRDYDPSNSRYCAFGYIWDECAAEVECHNIHTAGECPNEGVYSVKVANVVYSADLHDHVVLCCIDHPVELDAEKFEDKQGDAIEGECERYEDTPLYGAINDAIDLHSRGYIDAAKKLLQRLVEEHEQKKNAASSECRGTGTPTSHSKEVAIIHPTPDEVLAVTTKGIVDGGSYNPNSPSVLGPNGQFIRGLEFRHLTRCGCVACSRDLDLRDAAGIYWLDKDGYRPVCKECCTDRALQEDLSLDIPINVYLSRKRMM